MAASILPAAFLLVSTSSPAFERTRSSSCASLERSRRSVSASPSSDSSAFSILGLAHDHRFELPQSRSKR